MDADVARALFFNGATLVLLDTPAGTEVGLDYQLWTVTARFSGVKMIPPGVHCLFYRYLCDGDFQCAARYHASLTGRYARRDLASRRDALQCGQSTWRRRTAVLSGARASEPPGGRPALVTRNRDLC